MLQTIISFMTKNVTASQMRKLVKQFKDSDQSQKEFAAILALKKVNCITGFANYQNHSNQLLPYSNSKKIFCRYKSYTRKRSSLYYDSPEKQN